MSSYHFYLYDETPDGIDLRLWEWPRVTPKDDQLANNGICEDGEPAFNASIPQGEYYVAFGGAECATKHVNLSTGLIAGCGRVDLVPCKWGTDCTDCGRSATQEIFRQRDAAAAAHVTYPRRTGNRRRALGPRVEAPFQEALERAQHGARARAPRDSLFMTQTCFF